MKFVWATVNKTCSNVLEGVINVYCAFATRFRIYNTDVRCCTVNNEMFLNKIIWFICQ